MTENTEPSWTRGVWAVVSLDMGWTVNSVHRIGMGLNGTTGANFFSGNSAATIQVNSQLVADPSLVQASAANGAPGNNSVALLLAQIGHTRQSALNNQTFDPTLRNREGWYWYAEDVRVPMAPSARTDSDRMLERVRQIVLAQGYDEAMTISLVPRAWSEAFSPWTESPPLESQIALLRGADQVGFG